MRLVVVLLVMGCGEATSKRRGQPEPTFDPTAPEGAENVLVVLLDDVGIDKVGAYGAHSEAPPTPNLDALAAEGVRFEHAYAHPTCTPSRAALLTGQYASRAGLGSWIDPWTDDAALDVGSVTLPRVVEASPEHAWSSAAVGKWHLTTFLRKRPGEHPLELGFGTHRGSLGNPTNSVLAAEDDPRGYFRWEKSVDGDLSWSETYMTVDTVDDALALAVELPEPWLLYVAFNAAHTPLHVPPADLLVEPLSDAPDDAELFGAMVTALDSELGRLFEGLAVRTAAPITTLVIGDNGTPSHAILPPLAPERSKGTVSEGGVRVPFIVSGPRVTMPGAVSQAPVHVVDVLPTVAAIAGVEPSSLVDSRGQPWVLDGADVTPLLADPSAGRERLLYSEHFGPNGEPPWFWYGRTLRDDRYKIVISEHAEALFRLSEGLDEGPDLLTTGTTPEDEAAREHLLAELDAIEQHW